MRKETTNIVGEIKKQKSLLFLFSWILLCIVSLFYTPNDYEGYLEITDAVNGSGFLDFTGKTYVALFFIYLEMIIPVSILGYLLMMAFCYLMYKNIDNYILWIAVLFVTLPMAGYLTYISKEFILFFIFISSGMLREKNEQISNIYLLFSILIFSILIRQYYIPILLFSFFIVSVRSSIKLLMLLVVFGIIAIVLSCYDYMQDVFNYVYESKYNMWARLYYYSEVNTIFHLEFHKESSFINIVYMWLQNLYYLISAPFRHFGLKGFIILNHLVVVVILYFCYFKNELWYYFTLFSIIFMTYLVPDSGTFIRHASCLTVLFLTYNFTYKDSINRNANNDKN
ncbi:hypothetical protein [Vibrio coralliirubri]|uniref:hypothetical protein n=1 Tax=Vibrio coralliirubri TaxID=1516159 RepID=UPI00069CBA19|nr:hypothetical protein [Vibrio coralliirubri]